MLEKVVEVFFQKQKGKVKAEMRMHSNRKVEYKGKSIVIKKIKKLQLHGKRKAYTIKIKWHGMELFIEAIRWVKSKKFNFLKQ